MIDQAAQHPSPIKIEDPVSLGALLGVLADFRRPWMRGRTGAVARVAVFCWCGMVCGRKSWVRTYELVTLKNSRSPWGQHVRMRDSAGRELRISFSTLQQDGLVWDLVYNGVLHSVVAGNAETDGSVHLHLRLPYRSPYSG
jgi:hypothetical protein